MANAFSFNVSQGKQGKWTAKEIQSGEPSQINRQGLSWENKRMIALYEVRRYWLSLAN